DAEISQVYRDARIGPIFEGTNYIQAQDLLARKVIRDDGRSLGELLDCIGTAARQTNHPRLAGLREGILDACSRLRAAGDALIHRSGAEPELVGATAHHFLQWLGVLTGGWQLALACRDAGGADGGSAGAECAELRSMIDCAAFYGSHILPRMPMHAAIVA